MDLTVTPDIATGSGYLVSISEDLEHVSSSLDQLLQFFNDWDLIDILNQHSNNLLFTISVSGTLLLAFLLLCHIFTS